MSDRVLSTMTAKETIVKMQQIINGPLIEQIRQLSQQGETLSDPNIWDGQHAIRFRGDWQQTQRTLMNTQQALEELRRNIEQINSSIMSAGGNA